ncbi:MAG TPA: hypothetical protein VEH76_00020 [Methylocystis sp.]|nr:hypothetical protein [Methylocystis sp.]
MACVLPQLRARDKTRPAQLRRAAVWPTGSRTDSEAMDETQASSSDGPPQRQSGNQAH